MPNEKDKTGQQQGKANPTVPNTLNGSRATDQQSYEQKKRNQRHKLKKVYYAKWSKEIPPTSTFRNTEVPTINTIDAVI